MQQALSALALIGTLLSPTVAEAAEDIVTGTSSSRFRAPIIQLLADANPDNLEETAEQLQNLIARAGYSILELEAGNRRDRQDVSQMQLGHDRNRRGGIPAVERDIANRDAEISKLRAEIERLRALMPDTEFFEHPYGI